MNVGIVPTAVTLEALPARFGDCLLLECHRQGTRPWRLLVDGGPPDCWPGLRNRLLELPAADRVLDLVVVSHIDSDHIGGALRLFGDGEREVPGLRIHDVWFNGLDQLPDPDTDTTRSVSEGEDLMALLAEPRPGGALPWNRAFAGAAVMTPAAGTTVGLTVPDGPTLTVLSPTWKRLAILRRKWIDVVDRLRRGEADEEPEPVRPVAPLGNLKALAATPTARDQSAANGSSIVLLVEHRGASCLLAADAFPNVLGSALDGLARARGDKSVRVDAFKLPHHGSRASVTAALVGLAPADHYLICTNGDRFGHPDDEALARVIVADGPERALWFNYRTARTVRWSAADLQRRYRFQAAYPTADDCVLRLELPTRS